MGFVSGVVGETPIINVVIVRVYDRARHIGARQKRSQSPGLLAGGLRTPKAQRVEVPAAIVTEQAIHMSDSEKLVRNVGSLLIPNVIYRATSYDAANQPVEFALCISVSALRRDHLPRHLVVRLVAGQGGANVIVKGNNAIGEADDLRVPGIVLEKIAEVHGPFIHPLRAAGQALDVLGKLVRGCVTD